VIEGAAPGRPPGRPKAAPAPPRKVSAQEAQASASMYLVMLDMAARSFAGPDAAMSSYERQLIEPPLGRILGRYGAVSDRLAGMADPIALLIGLAMWGGRIAQLSQTRQRPARQPAPGVSPEARAVPPVRPVPPPPPAEPVRLHPEITGTFTPDAGNDVIGDIQP